MPSCKRTPPSYNAHDILFRGGSVSNSEHALQLLIILQFHPIQRLTRVGEYDFQTDIKALTTRARDGHLSFNGDATQLFFFERNVAVVSISPDGLALPQIYAFGE